MSARPRSTASNTLRQYYPGMLQAFPDFASSSERGSQDAMGLLEQAPTPEQGRALWTSKITSALRRAGADAGAGTSRSAPRSARPSWRRAR